MKCRIKDCDRPAVAEYFVSWSWERMQLCEVHARHLMRPRMSWRPILFGFLAAVLLGVLAGVSLQWLPIESLWTTR